MRDQINRARINHMAVLAPPPRMIHMMSEDLPQALIGQTQLPRDRCHQHIRHYIQHQGSKEQGDTAARTSPVDVNEANAAVRTYNAWHKRMEIAEMLEEIHEAPLFLHGAMHGYCGVPALRKGKTTDLGKIQQEIKLRSNNG